MSTERWDLLIIGAGPAGMAGAVTARERGLSVLVVDEAPDAGGHFYRGAGMPAVLREPVLGADVLAGGALIEAFAACGAECRPGTLVWQLTGGEGGEWCAMLAEDQGAGRVCSVQAGAVLLALGAQERPFPVSGWTLPGAMGVGAAQTLMKTQGLVPVPEAVLVGGGPLLYLFAYQLLQAGRRVQALLETSSAGALWAALPRLPRALLGLGQLAKGVRILDALRKAGIPRIRGVGKIEIAGSTCVEGVRFQAGARGGSLATPLVLLHHGFIPAVNLSRSLGCLHDWDPDQFCWRPRVDLWGQSSRPGIWIAGDGAAIAGARTARWKGVLAALDIARAAGRGDAAALRAKALRARLGCLGPQGMVAFTDRLYRPPDWLRRPGDDVVVCRCESVTAGEVRRLVQLGCLGPNQMKAFTRCGMGDCQGRFCGPTVSELLAQAGGRTVAEVGYFRLRPPLKPVPLEAIAAAEAPVERGKFPS